MGGWGGGRAPNPDLRSEIGATLDLSLRKILGFRNGVSYRKALVLTSKYPKFRLRRTCFYYFCVEIPILYADNFQNFPLRGIKSSPWDYIELVFTSYDIEIIESFCMFFCAARGVTINSSL